MIDLIKLEEGLKYLRLDETYELVKLKQSLGSISDESLELIYEICNIEIASKSNRASQTMIKTSNFPHHKTLDEFDFTFQPGISEGKIKALTDLKFVDNHENIIFIGSPGVGKTHLATSIGLATSSKRISTYFIKCSQLLTNLKEAFEENRLDDRLKHYCKYKVLIIDEVGFLPINELESKILFQLIDKRYEKKSTIFTSNLTFDKWHTLFGQEELANAIIDRIVHHSHLFNISGDSYRLKDKLDDAQNRAN